jgi:N-acyl-L-homoserine lactone synthetase
MNIAVQPDSLDGIDPMHGVDYRLAETEAEHEAIYRLRYRAYLREGAVAPSPSEMTVDEYDGRPNAWNFAVHIDGELCSAFRVMVLNARWPQSPSGTMFADVLGALLAHGGVVVDPGRFVADPEKSRQHPRLSLITARLGILACEHFGADLGLAIVRPEHAAFYRRYMLHQQIAAPVLYPGLLKPVGLWGVDCQDAVKHASVLARTPLFRSSAFERRMLFKDSETRLR